MPLGVCCYSHKWYVKNFRVSFDFLRSDRVYLRWSTLLAPARKETRFFVQNAGRLTPEQVCHKHSITPLTWVSSEPNVSSCCDPLPSMVQNNAM